MAPHDRSPAAATVAVLLLASLVAESLLATAAPRSQTPDFAANDPLESALLALNTRQLGSALRQLETPAAQGNAEAQYLLGLATLSGPATPNNLALGTKWLRLAAEQHHAAAAWALAGLLATPDLGPQTAAATAQLAESRQWLENAAALGYPLAVEAKKHGRLPLANEQPGPRSEHALRVAFMFWAARHGDPAALDACAARELLGDVDEFGRSALGAAAEAGALPSVQWLLAAHADVNFADSFGTTPLMLAAASNSVAVTQALIAAGARVAAVDHSDRTALMFATWGNRAHQINALLDARAEPDSVDERGWTALDIAIQRDRDAAAAVLRARGAVAKQGTVRQARSGSGVDPARPGELYHGWSPLLVAVSRDDGDAVRRLLAAGADANAVSPQGDPALHLAIDDRAPIALQALINGGASIAARDRGGRSALAKAALSSDLPSLTILLGTRVDLRGADSPTDPLLLEVVRRAYKPVLARLLDAGLPTTAVDETRQTALMLAVRGGNTAIVELLLTHGADVSAVDLFGRDALWYAASSEVIAPLDSLLRAHAALDTVDIDGVTALIAAAAAGRTTAVTRLLAAGASINRTSKRGDTALITAAAAGRIPTVRTLIAARAAVDMQNSLGDTALIAAARGGFTELCSMLLRAGSNTRLRNSDKVTASDVAGLRGFASIAQTIEHSQ